jgi:hypothetical protein
MMRAKWWVGVMTIAVAAPFGARADIQPVKVSDFWDSVQVKGVPRLPVVVGSRTVAAESQSDLVAAVLREPTAIRAVDTYMRPVYMRPIDYARRGSEASTAVGGGGYVAAQPRVVSTTTPHLTAAPAAAPEVNAGLAATGLTLLFGGVAILRGRRTRSNA